MNPTDTEMLDFLIRTAASVGRLTLAGHTKYRVGTQHEVMSEWHDDPKDAIREAIENRKRV